MLWKTIPGKEHPISGAVHGMMGIAEAFTLADRILGTDRYAEEAGEALAFEAESYRERTGDWPDLRLPGNNKTSRGNCYGAEGIGIILNRLREAQDLIETAGKMAVRAEKAVRRHPDYNLDHLCCGNMSAAEYYLETGDRTAAGLRLAQVIRSKEINGFYRLGTAGFRPNHNVTLFYGLAGIGYELLRYAFPQRFPSVL